MSDYKISNLNLHFKIPNFKMGQFIKYGYRQVEN